MASQNGNGKGPIRRSQKFRVLDELAAKLIGQQENRKCNASPGGDIHAAYMEYCKNHPDTLEEFDRTFQDVRDWDAATRPKVDREKGQGIFSFYAPHAFVPVDEQGGRKRLGDLDRNDLDAWWEIQEAEKRAQDIAHKIKKDFKTQVRRHMKKPDMTVGKVMQQVFGFKDEP